MENLSIPPGTIQCGHPEFKVVSIQQCPGRIARVSSSTDSGAAKLTLEELGVVTIRGVQCPVIRPALPPSACSECQCYNYPYEFCDAPIATTLGNYGSVKNVGFQRWTNIPDVSTGTRLVRMTVESDSLVFVYQRFLL